MVAHTAGVPGQGPPEPFTHFHIHNLHSCPGSRTFTTPPKFISQNFLSFWCLFVAQLFPAAHRYRQTHLHIRFAVGEKRGQCLSSRDRILQKQGSSNQTLSKAFVPVPSHKRPPSAQKRFYRRFLTPFWKLFLSKPFHDQPHHCGPNPGTLPLLTKSSPIRLPQNSTLPLLIFFLT